MNRRQACKAIGHALVASPLAIAQKASIFQINYVLSSALYGEMDLDTILPEIEKAGCQSIDIWRRKHGNQREQIAEIEARAQPANQTCATRGMTRGKG